jgi:dTDP-4-amino-4,6-dideoxygalactose transaminase
MIPIAKPCIDNEEKAAVLEVLESGMLAQGPKVKEFEEEFAKFIGVKHAIATSNGTTALHAALLAHNIKEGDEVITSSFSFIATANTIKMTGATPIFIDIDEKTFNLDPNKIEHAISKRTKAIMPVHLYGQAADMEKIESIAKKHNLLIIEDACQAHGAEIRKKKVGSFGTGCFSFYPTKNMTTGEGGMITTNDEIIAKNIRKIISHGSEKRYYHDLIGFNYRMTDLAASIGIVQLKKLLQFNEARKKNAAYLTQKIKSIEGLIVPEINPSHVFHQYTIRITKEFPLTRDKLSEILKESGIDNAIFYPVPIHQQKAYPEYHHLRYPISEKISKEVLSLPVHPSLTSEELGYIIRTIKEIDLKK